MLTDGDKRTAIALVFKDWRVRMACRRRDEGRMGRIIDAVWGECLTFEDRLADTPEDKDYASRRCHSALSERRDYWDLTSFIIPILVSIVIKIIISLLVDYFFAHEGRQ